MEIGLSIDQEIRNIPLEPYEIHSNSATLGEDEFEIFGKRFRKTQKNSGVLRGPTLVVHWSSFKFRLGRKLGNRTRNSVTGLGT